MPKTKNTDKKKIKAACDKRYREKNKEKIANKKKEYYQKNKNKINQNPKKKQSVKEYYQKNKNAINERRKNKRLLNIESERLKERERKAVYKKNIKNRKKWLSTTRKYVKNRLENDPIYKLKYYYRNCFGKMKRKNGFNKTTITAEYLGCDWETFKFYIESKFEPWMNWGNWGVYNPNGPRTWNIDHIIPLAHFDFSKQEEIYKAFNYTNCRPYCSRANLTEQHYR